MGTVVHDICPTASGAKDWNPSAYSRSTGLMYIPHENLCMDWENVQANYIAGTPYVGANVVMKAGPGGNRGEFTAWDPVQKKPAWTIKEDLPLWSGTWPPPATWSSTQPSTAGSRPSTPAAAN